MVTDSISGFDAQGFPRQIVPHTILEVTTSTGLKYPPRSFPLGCWAGSFGEAIKTSLWNISSHAMPCHSQHDTLSSKLLSSDMPIPS